MLRIPTNTPFATAWPKRESLCREWGGLLRVVLGASLLALSTTARAEDAFGLGNGHSGPLLVAASRSFTQNGFSPLSRNVIPGDRLLQVPNSDLVPADSLIMLIQMSGLSRNSGDQMPVEFTNETVGTWELFRVNRSEGGVVRLSSPVHGNYPVRGSQLVIVPEYTQVRIEPGGELSAAPWNGTSGGVLAFLAQSTVQNDGEVTVKGLGFRGGAFTAAPAPIHGCGFDFDLASPLGANKGEGLGNSLSDTRTGRGNVVNGGGGGNCYASGGGGGGNFGQGGKGGYSTDPVTDVGGLGGAAINFMARQRLFMGGGGGSGQGSYLGTGTSGAPGGGIVFFRAATLAGNGTLSASGLGANLATGECGAGGGGAGGTVHIRLMSGARCYSIQANGGSGGNNASAFQAPGGGGGGGVVFLQAAGFGDCHVEALGGSAGTQPDVVDGTHGATPTLSLGFESPYTGHLELFQEAYDPRGTLPDGGVGVVVPNLPLDGGQPSGVTCEENCDSSKRYRVGWGCYSTKDATAFGACIAGVLAALFIMRRRRR